jgi:hypothetical protein
MARKPEEGDASRTRTAELSSSIKRSSSGERVCEASRARAMIGGRVDSAHSWSPGSVVSRTRSRQTSTALAAEGRST